MRDGGKGDRQRPLGVPEETFTNNWDSIFGSKCLFCKRVHIASYVCDEKKASMKEPK